MVNPIKLLSGGNDKCVEKYFWDGEMQLGMRENKDHDNLGRSDAN